ncbi:unnamed protein product [Toxocara canis]|uniref:DUF4365 domain-containing protein n=1 Tax=Toxocara canis TaxID=6265 RepID=A0A183UYK5_TOXCA|nr:unnamed protein product [Toxocara canis]
MALPGVPVFGIPPKIPVLIVLPNTDYDIWRKATENFGDQYTSLFRVQRSRPYHALSRLGVWRFAAFWF